MADNDNLTFTSNKDGTISVKDSEGKEVRYAKEADLLAVKGSSEAAEKRATEVAKQAEESQKTHVAEIATANTNLETTRQQVLQAEAKVSGLEEKVNAGAGSAEELATVKQSLEAAKAEKSTAEATALESRRALMVMTYGIPAKDVEEKTMEQLGYYEEALKAVIATKGVGNYAIGGGGGGQNLQGIKPMELARMAYSEKK